MSTELATTFGADHGEKYAKVLEEWSKVDISTLDETDIARWRADLQDALGPVLAEELLSEASLSEWDHPGITLPQKDTLHRYASIAVKFALGLATVDLLNRFSKSVAFNKANPVDANTPTVSGEARPGELMKRAPQTVAQVFDMAKDKLNSVISKRLKDQDQLTGEKMWVTAGKNSRHADLNGVKSDGDTGFKFNRKTIRGPRPVNGDPADWSNCSCIIKYKTKGGKWV